MKALVLTTSYPVASGMASGSFLRDLLGGLAERAWEFEVVVPSLPDSAPAPDEPGIVVQTAGYPGARWAGGLAHRRGLPETLAAEPWKWSLVPGMVWAMERTGARRLRHARAAGRPFDLVWSHWLLPAGAVGTRLARTHGLPHAVTAHGADVHRVERIARSAAGRAALRHLWRDTSVSAPAALTSRRVAAALGREVAVCPLPAGADEPATRRARGPARLLFLGRFEPIKGPDLLLAACARVPAARLAGVTMAGSGSLESGLRERARGLAHAVGFAGVLEGRAKRDAIAAAHLMVLPSRRLRDGRTEGLPHAALEAMAAGTPVLAPGGGALGALIERTGAGMTYDASGPEARAIERLAAAIQCAVAPERLERMAAAAALAGAAFAPSRAIPAWQEFLARAVRRAA